MPLKESLLDLIRQSFFCDGHADTFRNLLIKGKSFFGTDHGCHLSSDVLSEASQNLQIMAIYTTYQERGPASTVSAMRILENARKELDANRERCGLVLSSLDLNQCRTDSKPYVLLSLEGADPFVGSLELVDAFFRSGLRAVGFTHNHNSVAAGGCAPPDDEVLGLRPFGKKLVERMEQLGMMIDTAHLGRRAFDDLMSIAKGPVVNSHSCCREYVDLERNLDDAQMKAIAASGGVVAVTYVPKFLTSEQRSTTSQDVFKHLEYMVNLIGIDHVGLGSDFDGVDCLPSDLGDPRGTHHLVKRMLDAGWNESQVQKVLGGNWYRVLEQILPKE